MSPNNLLWNPSPIKKAHPRPPRSSLSGRFPYKIKEVLSSGSDLLSRSDEGDLHLYKISREGLSLKKTLPRKLTKEEVLASGSSYAAWSEGNYFHIASLADDDDSFPKPPLPGASESREALHLHFSAGYLYCLWSEGDIYRISRTYLTNDEDSFDWEEIDILASEDPILFSRQSDYTLFHYLDRLSFRDKKRASLMSAGPGNIGRNVIIDESGLSLDDGKNWGNLITRGREDGTYYALEYGTNSADITLYGLRDQYSVNLFQHQKDLNYKNLLFYMGRLYLLADSKLFIYSENELLQEIEIDDGYEKITATDKGALLWSEGSHDYQLFGN